jgi:hypothetical protein
LFERKASGKRGKARLRLTRRGRKWLHGIALAFLPIITAAGIITEQTAALWATLIGAILVPWIALEDNHSAELESREQYRRGLDEGYDAATNHDEGETWQH